MLCRGLNGKLRTEKGDETRGALWKHGARLSQPERA